ncbi:MAG: UvrD-helicase domain-containing protein [Cyclobacteriaceae bacterium]
MDSIIEERPFHIYKSSAGSGKTYTLTKEYLKIALQRPGAFRQILGVTFTNKATEEMKSRIVTVLRDISDDKKPPVQAELEQALAISSAEIKKVAANTLSDILHQYGRFSVVTIDSFFHQVIRSFAREMGLQGSFSIDLDLPTVMQQVVDEMLMEVGNADKKPLKKWLTEFAEERVENGDPWDIRKEINSLAGQVLTDEFKPYTKQVLELSKDPRFFNEVKKRIDQKKYGFENGIKALCKKASKIMADVGVSPEEFKGGSGTSPALIFQRVLVKFELSDAQRRPKSEISEWIKAKDPNEAKLQSAISEGLIDCHEQLLGYFEREEREYQSAKEALRYFYTFGILSEINRKIQDYRDENDVMLIADLPDFLHQIINDSETPYIYEKVGSLFQNYLIDEFQDTSAFQWDNFKPLVKNASDMGHFGMVVGDVKQSIYRWRGGDWQLLQSQVKNDIGDYLVREESLNMNWRSGYQVVAFNNDFFTNGLEASRQYFGEALQAVQDQTSQQQIAQRIDEVLATYSDVSQEVPDSKPKDRGYVRLQYIGEEETAEEEDWRDVSMRETIRAVEEAQHQGFDLRDIAILTRTKPEGKKVARAFMDYKSSGEANESLKYDVVSSEALYLTASHLVRFVISLIRWLNDEGNTIVLAEWIFEYERFIKQSDKTETQIFSATDHWQDLVPPSFVQRKDYLKTLPLYELVEQLIATFELDTQKDEFIYLLAFQDAILDYSKTERGDISSFLEWWEKVKDKKSIQISDDNNAVKIMTMHKSKGLEFPVVIIPFLSWELDHDAKQSNILWCEGRGNEPYNRLPVLPLKYGSALANTHWAMDYYEEKLKAFLDNLNLLYVAFTRPVDALIAFGKLPKPSKGSSSPDLEKMKVRSVGDLALNIVRKLDGFDGDKYVYTKGDWSAPKGKNATKVDEFELARYHSHAWRDKANIQMKDALGEGQDFFSEAIRQGVRIHDLISRVKHKKDLEHILDTPERSFITKVVEHPAVAEWFEEKWQVDTEVTILLPDGEFKRIDRINRQAGETIVIDFKTGSPRDKDKYQVKEYMKILREMGFANTTGRLLYLTDMEVMEV